MTFTTIFTVVADFGMGPVLTREVARYPEYTDKYLSTIFWTKGIFGLGAYLAVVFFVNVLNYSELTKLLVYLSGITMFFDNLHAAFYSVFRARKNLIYESVGIVASQAITLAVGSLVLLLHWPLYWLILAYTIPSILNFIYAAYFLRKVYSLKYSFIFDKNVFKLFLMLAWPFALAGIISRLYSYSDSLLMSKMLSAQALGWWSVPYKITFAFQFIPAALSASIFPVMSALYVDQKEKIGELFLKSWRYLFTIVLPLAFGIIALADPIILKLYKPQYAPAIPVLRILMISLIFGFLGFITAAVLNATNHQKKQTSLLAVALFVNILLNLYLLPRSGIMGAAVAALVSNIVLCLGGLWYCNKIILIDKLILFKYLNQSFWPAATMGVLCFYLSKYLHFIFVIPIGALVYFVALFMIGGIDRNLIARTYNKIFKNQVI
ncbi:MAG: polysaccharide biosynthesis protein [uncultured bacterium]|nr:MAG: polysaccharide biosynthesis protein [uncultured bacterium]